jgi:sugar phosphate isomerase/epimerase
MTQTISRRAFVGASAAMTAATILPGAANAASGQRFFGDRGPRLGLQIYTLGEGAGKDIDATFAHVAAMGYREIELPSLLGHGPKELRVAADRAGLSIPSIHLPLTRMTMGMGAALSFASAPAAIAEALGTLGAKTAIAPLFLLPDGFRPLAGETFQTAIGRAVRAAGADLWKTTAALLNERAAALKPAGIATGYHNHNPEFTPLGQTTGFDVLKRELDPALVHFEVDLGWVAAAGHDPVTFLATLHGRVGHVHHPQLCA